MKNISTPAILIFFGLGVCPLLAGLAFFWGSGQISMVTCTRVETTHVDCHIERAFLGAIPAETWSISRVTGTELTTRCEDNSCTYGVNLLANDDIVPLSNLQTSDRDGVAAEQARLDDFLADTEAKAIEFSSGPAWGGMALSSLFILIGGFVATKGIRKTFKVL